jgi:hypothetical protein
MAGHFSQIAEMLIDAANVAVHCPSIFFADARKRIFFLRGVCTLLQFLAGGGGISGEVMSFGGKYDKGTEKKGENVKGKGRKFNLKR